MFDPAEVHRLPLFRSVSKAKLMEALAAFMPSEVDPGQVLMVEGEADRSMVLVLDGELSVHIGRDNVEVARMGRGEVVGEMALFGVLDRRAATVRTLSPCRLLILDLSGLTFLRRKRSPVVTLLEEYALVIMARRLRQTNERIGQVGRGEPLPQKTGGSLWGRVSSIFGGGRGGGGPTPDPLVFLVNLPAFREQDPGSIAALAARLKPEAVPAGEVIVREGEAGDRAWLLLSGQVQVYRSCGGDHHERIARLREGSFFGLASIIDGSPRSATCIAETSCWVAVVPGDWLRTSELLEPHEAALLRRGALEALAAQVRLANAHVEHLEQQLSSRPTVEMTASPMRPPAQPSVGLPPMGATPAAPRPQLPPRRPKG